MPETRKWINRQTQVCVTLTLLVQDLNAWNPPVDQQRDTGMCDLDITGIGSQCLEPASRSRDRHRYVTLTLLVQDLNAWNPPVDQQTDTGM